ncbi:hypothetical protein DWA10_20250 [Acinetobacter baumannii]|nr:hypothetical protein DWA10_20250 [Acinetobacter baumannii]
MQPHQPLTNDFDSFLSFLLISSLVEVLEKVAKILSNCNLTLTFQQFKLFIKIINYNLPN